MKNGENKIMEIVIDARGQSLGRLASRVALTLRGKDMPSYTRNIAGQTRVKIVNASVLKLTDKKARQTKHVRYTGYPGGLRQRSLKETIARKGHGELIRKAVKGMIPNNKLRPIIMKHLII